MVNVGDIVQIVPDHDWGGCLVIVTELKSFGVQGIVTIPRQGDAYVRLRNEDFVIAGKAVFMPMAMDD